MKQKLFTLLAAVLIAMGAVAQTTHEGHEYVDLGLTSGTLWATYNVGASSPEGKGDYFAWGETKPKTTYALGTYAHGTSSTALTKYYTTDSLTVLEAADDAATANWGGKWRMPTKAEQDELREACTWTQDTLNGVSGYRITGTNEQSIFLPATGYYNDATFYGAASGYYWSSQRDTTVQIRAYALNFSSESYRWYFCGRYDGLPVRAVQSAIKYTITATASGNGTVTGSGEYIAGRTATLTAIPNEGYAFAGWSDGNTDNPRTITVSQDLTFTATFVAFEYVDLGLSSGTLWATFNVGAGSPEQYGDYFAWGETIPHQANADGDIVYDWSTYKYCNGSSSTMTKYCTNSRNGTVDNKTTLDITDDAATANWGGDWRMPTTEEQTELRTKCTWTWTTLNGVNGYRVVGPNGNSIFLPAAGYRVGKGLSYVGSDGYYWSSSLGSYPTVAYLLYFYSDDYDWDSDVRYSLFRNSGASVRPVQSPVKYTLTVTASEGGTVTGTGEYIANRTATLTATPNEGYAFAGWSDGNTDNPRIVTVTQDSTFTATFAASEYVDLGLTSGTLWATCNVGATSPEQYGDYFAWGETIPHQANADGDIVYDWSTYKYSNGSSSTMTKYCTNSSYGTVDNKTTLDITDDAATANWGGDWRMPTTAEQQELLNECTWKMTKNYNSTGVAGHIVTGTNGNSIFLPAAGYRTGSYLYNVGSYGYYWSSSVNESYPSHAYYLFLISGNLDWGYYNRFYGNSVRPVQSKKGTLTGVETVSHSVSVEVRKVLEDGVIYILRGDEKYMIDGRKVE